MKKFLIKRVFQLLRLVERLDEYRRAKWEQRFLRSVAASLELSQTATAEDVASEIRRLKILRAAEWELFISVDPDTHRSEVNVH